MGYPERRYDCPIRDQGTVFTVLTAFTESRSRLVPGLVWVSSRLVLSRLDLVSSCLVSSLSDNASLPRPIPPPPPLPLSCVLTIFSLSPSLNPSLNLSLFLSGDACMRPLSLASHRLKNIYIPPPHTHKHTKEPMGTSIPVPRISMVLRTNVLLPKHRPYIPDILPTER